jgi:hypothetical protein
VGGAGLDGGEDIFDGDFGAVGVFFLGEGVEGGLGGLGQVMVVDMPRRVLRKGRDEWMIIKKTCFALIMRRNDYCD